MPQCLCAQFATLIDSNPFLSESCTKRLRPSKLNYENTKNVGHFRVFSYLRGLLTIVWPAKNLQLAARRRRERATGPGELSLRAYLPSRPEWRQPSRGYQGAAVRHDIHGRCGGVDPGLAASRRDRRCAA